MSDSPDYFYRVPHPKLAWSILSVEVRRGEQGWQFAYGYHFMNTGMGCPFRGRFPSRESAGRNGMLHLRDALKRFAASPGLPDRRCPEQKQAARYAKEIQEQLFPPQLELQLT
ncbi:hypothetical protein JIN85_20440 [Luteolibacter pohnpeiensis]|uniref:Uncharacterized protein n=1 Tax=Luteolibacter pohnpeiensis TaxID=454153 RepID=A0A934SB68_9BACT|nr:hypothetical protein [Luteolibacter pohnpeiensis]MBK1884790.1 hypothetical protein [Luteolibacter pohnpeiensis]